MIKRIGDLTKGEIILIIVCISLVIGFIFEAKKGG